MESSAVAFIVRGALRADRLAVRPLSAQCGAALRSISAAVRSILTAVRSIFTPHCGRFPRSAQEQCGRVRPHRCRAVRHAQ